MDAALLIRSKLYGCWGRAVNMFISLETVVDFMDKKPHIEKPKAIIAAAIMMYFFI